MPFAPSREARRGSSAFAENDDESTVWSAGVTLAREGSRALLNVAARDQAALIGATGTSAGHRESFELPPAVVRLLLDVLGQIAEGLIRQTPMTGMSSRRPSRRHLARI